MNIQWQIAPLSNWQADAVIFFVMEDAPAPHPAFQRWMETSAPGLSGSTALKDFQGKYQQVGVYYGQADSKIPRALCIGLGKEEKFELDKLRGAAAAAFRKCRELQLNRPAIPLSALTGLPANASSTLREALIGGMLGLYRYDALKTRDVEPSLAPETVAVLTENEPDEELRNAASTASAIVDGIRLARDLTVSPANQTTPGFMVQTARRVAEANHLHLQILDQEMAAALGMGGFLAVAQGSKEPAYVIIMEHAPIGTADDAPVVFVGKGITFDTGGISLKPSDKLDAMKQDMAGAAAVMGAMQALAQMGVKRRVIAIMPCTENMPGGKAYKPGDVIRSLSGLTIEVISTDAEGRMILCDALTYALRFKPAVMVDVATLTGACIIALGRQVAGLMGNRDNLNVAIAEIGGEEGEKLWPLPLWDFFFEGLKSDVADFKNVADRSGAAIVAGMFLSQFVPKEVPWAHLDIAGTAWADKDMAASPRGATGFGVRTLIEIAVRWPELETIAREDA